MSDERKNMITPDQVNILDLQKDVQEIGMAVDSLCYYIPINQNILHAIARLTGVKPLDLAKAIHKPELNKAYEDKIDKELKKFAKTVQELNKEIIDNNKVKKDDTTKTTPTKNSRQRQKKDTART